jgi:hypothetical protein
LEASGLGNSVTGLSSGLEFNLHSQDPKLAIHLYKERSDTVSPAFEASQSGDATEEIMSHCGVGPEGASIE